MKWFNRLKEWTDRKPLFGVLVLGVLCVVGIAFVFILESEPFPQEDARFFVGFMAGLFVAGLADLAAIWRITR